MCDMDSELMEYAGMHGAGCPCCGYSLQGLQIALCPECGFSFTLLQLQEQQKRIELDQKEWLKRVREIRMQSLIFAAVLLADAAAVLSLLQGGSPGKWLQAALFVAIFAAIELCVFVPLTSKKHRDSRLAYFVIGLCEEGFSAVILVSSLPMIIAVVYFVLWGLGYL